MSKKGALTGTKAIHELTRRGWFVVRPQGHGFLMEREDGTRIAIPNTSRHLKRNLMHEVQGYLEEKEPTPEPVQKPPAEAAGAVVRPSRYRRRRRDVWEQTSPPEEPQPEPEPEPEPAVEVEREEVKPMEAEKTPDGDFLAAYLADLGEAAGLEYQELIRFGERVERYEAVRRVATSLGIRMTELPFSLAATKQPPMPPLEAPSPGADDEPKAELIFKVPLEREAILAFVRANHPLKMWQLSRSWGGKRYQEGRAIIEGLAAEGLISLKKEIPMHKDRPGRRTEILRALPRH